MSETFKKSQMSEFFDVSSGCTLRNGSDIYSCPNREWVAGKLWISEPSLSRSVQEKFKDYLDDQDRVVSLWHKFRDSSSYYSIGGMTTLYALWLKQNFS